MIIRIPNVCVSVHNKKYPYNKKTTNEEVKLNKNTQVMYIYREC